MQISFRQKFLRREIDYNQLIVIHQGGIMAAQPQAFAKDTKNFSQAILPEFDHEMENTRKSLERVPEDKFSFKPHPKSMTLGALATHLATINHWAEAILGLDSFDVSTAPPNPELKSRAEVLAAFDKNTAIARKAIADATDAHLLKPWTLTAGSKTVLMMPRVAVVRSFLLNHTIHHRAQLGVYLRLNDVPVPSIYGPSADEGNM
jgi:uncharacterized damage-inducible protein DinB